MAFVSDVIRISLKHVWNLYQRLVFVLNVKKLSVSNVIKPLAFFFLPLL